MIEHHANFVVSALAANLDAALRVQTRPEIAKLHEQIGTSSMICVAHDQIEVMPAKFVRAEPAHAVVEVEGEQVTVAAWQRTVELPT